MKPQMRLETAKGIIFLTCSLVFCLVLCTFIGYFLGSGGLTTQKLRVMTVIQDIFVFVLPAVMTAVVATRYPARFLEVDRLPSLKVTLLAIATLLAAIPAIDFIVKLNESISLPESMASIEAWMHRAEENATMTTEMLMSGNSIGTLVISLLIVGVLTGFSEEIFFRGTLQRLLTPVKGSAHMAVWVTAFIFSAIHLQFFGFFPRLLLGAFFGYLLVWSGSLWLPVIGHALNNSLVVLSTWLVNAGYMTNRIDRLGAPSTTWDIALGSAVLVGGLIVLLRREALREAASKIDKSHTPI